MSSKTDIQGIPMPNPNKNIPMPAPKSTTNDKKVNINMTVQHEAKVKLSSQNVTNVTKTTQPVISTERNSNLEQKISKTPSMNISSSSPAVPKTSVLGIENAKRRLRAFAIQKKGLPALPSQSSSSICKKSSNPLEAGNRAKRPPKKANTRKQLTIPEKLIPGLTDFQLSYAKPDLRDLNPGQSYVKSDLNYLKPELNCVQPVSYAIPELPELPLSREDVDKKRLLVHLGVPLGLIDTITTEKRMPTKAMPPIQGLIDHNKVEEFLKEAVEAQKSGRTLKFQYERQTFHNKIPILPTFDRDRLMHGRERDYDRRRERHRSRRDVTSNREAITRDKNSKERDRHSTRRDSKTKHDKPIKKKLESESDSKEIADVNLEDYLVCDSWSLDTEVKEDDVNSPNNIKSSKTESEKPSDDTISEKIEKIKAFKEMFSYGILDTDESDQDEAEYSAVTSVSSKTKPSDSQPVSEATPERIDSKRSSLEKDLETRSHDRSVRSQTSELKDLSVHETCESQTPEYEYPESEFSHISGDKGSEVIGRDLTDMKEEQKKESDGKDYWTVVLKICQPIMFKHDGDNCKKETKTQPSIVYKESPKRCLCVNEREAVYKEIGCRQALLVQSISANNSLYAEEECSSREWYPDVTKSLTCSTIDYTTNWETDSSQNSETRHEGRQYLKCPSPNTPQYEPDGSRTFLAQEYEKFMESVWPEIAEDERQNACFDNSSQDLSLYDEHSKVKVKSIEDSVLDGGKGKNKGSDEELVTPPKTKKKNKIKAKKEKSKIKMTRRKKRKPSSSASRSSGTDSSSSDSSDSSTQSEPDNIKKKKITKKTLKTKKAKLKAIKKKKAERSKLRQKILKEKQLSKKKLGIKKEKAKKQKEKEEEEKLEIVSEPVKPKIKSIKKREKIKERKKKDKRKKRDVSSSSSGSESDKEVKKTKKKKKAIKRKRIPSLSPPDKTKKKSKKEKKNKQKKRVKYDSNSVSDSESGHFDVNVLNNIKAERVSDEEMKDISEPAVPRPMESLEFSPRRRSNQNNNLPTEIISVSELHSEFENLRYKEVKIKQEVENEITVDETNLSQPLDSNIETNVEQSKVDEEVMDTADTKLESNVEIEAAIPIVDTKVDIQEEIPVSKSSPEKAVVPEAMEVERTHDTEENVTELGYEYYIGGYDENECFYGYENNTSMFDKESSTQHIPVTQSQPSSVEPGREDVHKQMELHQIETVVSNLTSRGEIKCDWRPGRDLVKSEIVEIRRSRWGMEPKPCETDLVHTTNVDFSKPPPNTATTEVYRIPSILDTKRNYSDNQKVYKIETISSSHLREREPSPHQYTEVADFPEPMCQDYAEAYQDVYGAADQLQYGDCFAQNNGAADKEAEEEEKRRRLSLDDRINMVLAAVQAKAMKQEAEMKAESPNIIPDRGILMNGGPEGVRLSDRPIVTKRVSFADGYNPGQDSDTEEPPIVQKRRLGAPRRRGCAYPCLPGHPDYDPLWDALPPPPPPPGSPPPALQPPVSTHVLRASRHRSRTEEVSQLIVPGLAGDKYAGITRLPKGLGHPE